MMSYEPKYDAAAKGPMTYDQMIDPDIDQIYLTRQWHAVHKVFVPGCSTGKYTHWTFSSKSPFST